uniref:Uncharacterized protein n=1 Tax=Oryza rufipogon TaxID=4529 RepID=A0A0E0QR71_ORYRU
MTNPRCRGRHRGRQTAESTGQGGGVAELLPCRSRRFLQAPSAPPQPPSLFLSDLPGGRPAAAGIVHSVLVVERRPPGLGVVGQRWWRRLVGKEEVSVSGLSVRLEAIVEPDSPGRRSEGSLSSSFRRKVVRLRSVGCGSRSFLGDFLELLSTGFSDCVLRRVESHCEPKPKSSVGALVHLGGSHFVAGNDDDN